MKYIYILLGLLLTITACDADLDQVPPNIAKSDSLTDYEGVLYASYYYQLGAVTPMAVMGEFRSDNALMDEAPYTEFDEYDNGLTAMEDQFFGPFYTALYKSILSANNVIANSTDDTQIGEAKFLRALSYFKLIQVFGDVSVILTPQPAIDELEDVDLERQPVDDIYDAVIIPDLQDAIDVLDEDTYGTRAGVYPARALLGKVYVTRGDFVNAETVLEPIISGASSVGIELKSNYNEIFGVTYEVENSEIIFSISISSSITDEYTFGSDFWNWFVGDDSKADLPVDPDLVAAFDESDVNGGGTDLRRAVTLSDDGTTAIKYPKEGVEGADHDWIEIRYADVIMLYAEALNENGDSAESVLDLLDPIRTRAGLDVLDHTVVNTQDLVRQAIYDERRVEFAFEGQRWFDLVRTGTVDIEMGETVDSNYYVFPIPVSEILATDGVITQNDGY